MFHIGDNTNVTIMIHCVSFAEINYGYSSHADATLSTHTHPVKHEFASLHVQIKNNISKR